MTSATTSSIFSLPLRLFTSEALLKKAVLLLVLLLVLPLLGLYLFQMGHWIQMNWQSKNAAKQIAEMTENNLIQQAQSMNQLSLSGIEKQIKGLNFVEAGHIKYIPLLSSPLAKKAQ